MALNAERVLEKFARYSGEDVDAGTARGQLCRELCEECAARVGLSADRNGIDGENGALESWAAAEAFYQLTLRDGAASPHSVTAAGVRTDGEERSSKARVLADEKRREAAPLLGEEAFWFGRI